MKPNDRRRNCETRLPRRISSPSSRTQFHRTPQEKHRRAYKKRNYLHTLKMGALLKLVDAVLFVFFVVIAVAAPLIDAQTCLPESLFPSVLVELKNWYAREYGDYLMTQKPHFIVGIVCGLSCCFSGLLLLPTCTEFWPPSLGLAPPA